ncbi:MULTISPECIES: DUF4274 domain-containing protein [Bacillus]|uniref:DUF4274 domain-containing protein n=1 Tax=Bacillus sonorensis TaxID=119858 RepID=A0ABN5AJC5_9BACI|nr:MULTISPECIES: DUF4274 domain-containing protein [Bacillus]ASB89424.1 hypothetical protein S101395_02917 [Bacillus sonorensis]MEC0338264.1 DUF4274 domain-containing protein [Bacillus sonorensis]MEC0425121.1 DUF4274 domain-containing protein [Bacillus sonorensis]MEC0460675.1 DUF4274 domain-containing protein [Bacillus sonorensis]MEC0526330.1 DUF4274 domain-containing protein [Bacillus sonorensis]
MDKKNINFLEELLYNTEKDSTISQVRNIDDPLLLHVFAANYNWNSGFDVPKAILENENCDFGTGLLMFHYADGYRMLENPDDVSKSTLEEWKDFLVQTYNKLINLQFKSQNISFDPELTKIQKFKLKKSNPNISDILLDKSPGHVVDVPKI